MSGVAFAISSISERGVAEGDSKSSQELESLLSSKSELTSLSDKLPADIFIPRAKLTQVRSLTFSPMLRGPYKYALIRLNVCVEYQMMATRTSP